MEYPTKCVSAIKTYLTHRNIRDEARKANMMDSNCPAVDQRLVAHAALDNNQNLSGQENNVGCFDSLSKNGEFQGSSEVPIFDLAPLVHRKPLLSDKWWSLFDDGVGATFIGGACHFRQSLIKYSTQVGFRYIYIKNRRTHIHAICRDSVDGNCPWFVKVSLQKKTNYFVLKKAILRHECVYNKATIADPRFGCKILPDLVVDEIRNKISMGGRDVQQHIKSFYGVDINYHLAWRAADRARSLLFGSYEESYDHLRWYCDAVTSTNPGSIVLLETNPTSYEFERVFIAFKCSVDGFKHCRPMLFIDGTFLKGRSKGILLSATSKDGDNGIFPVAIAVVSAENTENWKWFLETLRDHVHHHLPVVYLSDRNIGLLSAFPQVFDRPNHFFCLFHLLVNLKSWFGSGWSSQQRTILIDLFRECAYAPTLSIFHEKIDHFKEIGGKTALEFLDGLPYERWTMDYSSHIKRYGEMTSNAAESFNRWIHEARSLPIAAMLDCIHGKISGSSMFWTGALVPSKEELWNQLTEHGRHYVVKLCPSGQYEVMSTPSVVVDISEKTCSCHQWQIRGFPCAHGVAAIRKKGESIHGSIDPCFFAHTYRTCYCYDLHPIPQTYKYEFVADNEITPILPPTMNNQPGRPKKKRIRSRGEFPMTKTRQCSNCDKLGKHQPMTCAHETRMITSEEEETESD